MKPNRKVKDSVFCSILSNKKYALQAYLDLHPESDVTEDDIEIVTIENVLVNDFYNDFGMIVKNHNLILIEAQSTWSYNILFRALVYYVEEYLKIIDSKDLSLQSRKKLPFYVPEIYVVYSGKEKVPESISFEKDFNDGKHSILNLEIKAIYDKDSRHFFGQYLYFCRLLEENLKVYPEKLEAIKLTVKECIERNIFKEYFIEHESEVVGMLDLLFDEERARRIMIKEERAEAETIGEARGEKNMQKKIASNLKHDGLSIELIVQATGLTKEEIENL